MGKQNKKQTKQNNIVVLSRAKKKQIAEQLKQYYGICLPDCVLTATGKQKIWMLTAGIKSWQLRILLNKLNVQAVGLYFVNQNETRLSFDATQLMKSQIKNYVELNKQQTKQWFEGLAVELNEQQRKIAKKHNFVAVLCNFGNFKEYAGCGKIINNKLANFVPKERRMIKTQK